MSIETTSSNNYTCGPVRKRTFIKALSLAAVSAFGSRSILASEIAKIALPPYAKKIPTTPTDAPAGTWTLVVLPDTQNMSDQYPDEFNRQTAWIVAHRESHNIRFVVHEGDIVDRNTDQRQWKNAQKAMKILSDAGVPYALLPGNHDLGDGPATSENRHTLLNGYFTAADYRHSEAVGLFEEGKMENSWHEFTSPTGKYLILALEFGPRNEVLKWADLIVAARPNHKVIVVTHAHVYYDSTVYNWSDYGNTQKWSPKAYGLARDGDVNDGEDLWNKLLRKHANIFLVLSGHVIENGTGYTVRHGDYKQPVHQILANYQAAVTPHRPYGGGGYLRLMQFSPDGKQVQVKSYSPWLDEWLTTQDQQFTIMLG